MKGFIALIAGIVFSVGLVISGMINPDKVIGFLDIFGEWDYSLALVMGGAVLVNLLIFPSILKRKPVCDDQHYISENKELNRRLLIGSAMFGIGWGLVGICPGPGIVNLITLDSKPFIFVGAMVVGMIIYKFTFSKD